VPTAIGLIVAGYAIAFVEWVVMSEFFHVTSTYKHHYLGGLLLPLGFFLLALARPNLGHSTPLPYLAKFTLGVYVSHIFMIYTLTAGRWRLENLFPSLTPLWQFVFPFAVYLFAVLFTLILCRVPITRYLVTRSRPWNTSDTPRPLVAVGHN